MTTSQSSRTLRGIPALISIDRRSPKPLYQQVYEAYRARIVRGDLRAGDPVGSTRELARHLGVSRLPILNAYAQLLAEGHFESRPGSGTFIAGTILAHSRWNDAQREQRDAVPRLISTRARLTQIRKAYLGGESGSFPGWPAGTQEFPHTHLVEAGCPLLARAEGKRAAIWRSAGLS